MKNVFRLSYWYYWYLKVILTMPEISWKDTEEYEVPTKGAWEVRVQR
jgi:hypothetical protein